MNEKFKKELSDLLNKYSVDNEFDTPDYVLSEMLIKFLEAYAIAKVWNSEKPDVNVLSKIIAEKVKFYD